VCELLPEVEEDNICINFLVRRLSINLHYDPNSDVLWTLLSTDRRMPPNVAAHRVGSTKSYPAGHWLHLVAQVVR